MLNIRELLLAAHRYQIGWYQHLFQLVSLNIQNGAKMVPFGRGLCTNCKSDWFNYSWARHQLYIVQVKTNLVLYIDTKCFSCIMLLMSIGLKFS